MVFSYSVSNNPRRLREYGWGSKLLQHFKGKFVITKTLYFISLINP